MESDYIKIYSGNFMITARIIAELGQIGIVPVVKDESESSRLAGFPSALQEIQEIFVRNSETEKAKHIINGILADIRA